MQVIYQRSAWHNWPLLLYLTPITGFASRNIFFKTVKYRYTLRNHFDLTYLKWKCYIFMGKLMNLYIKSLCFSKNRSRESFQNFSKLEKCALSIRYVTYGIALLNATLKTLVLTEHNIFVTYERHKLVLNLKQVFNFDNKSNFVWCILNTRICRIAFVSQNLYYYWS